MDEPARKRRKTASPQDRESISSPLKKPPRRPSFASPTKASLARFNPSLLPRPTPSGPATPGLESREATLARGRQARAMLLGEPDVQQPFSDEVGQKEAQQDPRRSAERSRTTRPLGDMNEEEGGLPTTPSQNALEHQDTPRRGILFSSPSKRPPRLKDAVKQSPLKPRAKLLLDRTSPRPVDAGVENGHPQGAAVERSKQAIDPELKKRRQEKARLLRELEDLEDHVTQCAEEIEKGQEQPAGRFLAPSQRDDLIALINKVSTASVPTEEEHTPALSSLLCSFLPFSARVVPPPKAKGVPERPIPSHRPLELEDPLPYLSMFTDFKFTSHVGLAGSQEFDLSSTQVHQRHTIDIEGPLKLLTASISAVVDTSTNQIIDLQILRLPNWAERELGSFVRERAQEKDLNTVCWAVSSYWEIAKKRAEFWHKCQTTFKHLIAGRSSEDTENVDQQANTKLLQKPSRKDLHQHVGREILVLEDRHVLLKISWRITFDWTGEAESRIGVEPALPRVWSEADDNDSFRKIPETFDSLLQSKGVFTATKTMVSLLFAE